MKKINIGSEFGISRRGGYGWNRHAHHSLTSNAAVTLMSNGRSSLGLAAKAARHGAEVHRNTVLLPAYLCHSMIQPFHELGLDVRFYPVGSDLSIKPSEVLERLDHNTVAVMLMHYFGFPQAENLAAQLIEHFPHLKVIDDRTHLLLSDLANETRPSDIAISFYSPRKWGPFPDLGLVVWPCSTEPSMMERELVDRGYDWPFGSLRLLGLFLRSLFFAWPIETLRQVSLWSLRRADALLDRRVKIRKASPISRLLWRRWNWEPAWHARRKNYQYLLDNWNSVDITPLFSKLPALVCPLGFPVRTEKREKLKQFFITKGIFPPIHWARPHQVSPDEFPAAAILSEQELTIPLDQRYGLQHMDSILEVICHA